MKQKIICSCLFLFLIAGLLTIAQNKPAEFNPSPPPVGKKGTEDDSAKKSSTANQTSDSSVQQKSSPVLYSSNTFSGVSAVAAKKDKASKTVIINNRQYPLRSYKTLLTPNDPSASQWWVTNTKLEQAWDVPRGSHETLLAIIDTGFGLAHEEFDNRWYTNAGESGAASSEQPSTLNCTDRSLALDASCNLIDDDSDGTIDNETGAVTYQNPSRLNCTDQGKSLDKNCNRIDDDGNGHVDDTRGWDFINNDNSVQAGELNPAGEGTTHGTRVAGVAAATGNNARGIAGVDWGTKILPIQALDDDSYGDTLSVGRAILYAASQGADVISISLGSELPDPYVQEAVQTAIKAGSVVVAAAGNDACECMVYPANYPEVVAVGALHTDNQPAGFSSWGASLDILAPGTGIMTTDWRTDNQISAYASSVAGTSFATPMVGGMLTRMLSQQSSSTPLQLIAALTENTNRLTLGSSTSRSNTLGFGTLDAQKVTSRMSVARSINHLYAFTSISKGDFLTPSAPVEVISSKALYKCDQNDMPTTPVYDLTKSGAPRFFSASETEAHKAKQSGYSASFFSYMCLQLPHDTAATVRNINALQEFRNIYPKN